MKFLYVITTSCFLMLALYGKKSILPAYTAKTNTAKSPVLHLSNSYTHVFSDLVHKDTFSINLTGKSIINGRITFNIVNFNGKKIFTEKFAARDLLGDLIDIKSSAKQQEDTIKNRMKHFFEKENFKQPAIESADTFEGAYSNPEPSDKKDWEALKTDHKSIGFIYSYGYEGKYGIAWLKKKKKVFLYFYSD